jgi:toxin ParE1/3/4
MKIRYTETALAEIDEILSYIAKDNPLAADEVGAVLRAAIARLSDYPRLAIETDVPFVRVAPVLPYRYLVFYSVHEDALFVRNVRHAAQERPASWRALSG